MKLIRIETGKFENGDVIRPIVERWIGSGWLPVILIHEDCCAVEEKVGLRGDEREVKLHSHFLFDGAPNAVYKAQAGADTAFLTGNGKILTCSEALYRIVGQVPVEGMGPKMLHISIPVRWEEKI